MEEQHLCQHCSLLDLYQTGNMDQFREEKGSQTQTSGPDIFRWGGGLPLEGVGAKKFGMSFETQGNKTCWRDIPGILLGYPGVARKV